MVPTLLLQGILIACTCAFPVFEQQPLGLEPPQSNADSDGVNTIKKLPRGLQGRFLHITDFHPDPHYKVGSSSEDGDPCHRGKDRTGSTGYFGAAGSDCDSPFSLVNETFSWIEKNLKDSIDFVIWTGDSARHDNDEKVPRTEDEVVRLNEILADKFVNVFKDKRLPNGLSIPVVPTFGNNDIMPHNIFKAGPNRWTRRFENIWGKFIPEHQLHTFVEGGWFTSEVIPGKLSVISLNTMYFFDSNSAVDGCAAKSEPGYEHMEWLRVQLQLMRNRDMKAILIGHVPPARTDSKRNWDETCWQKYALWVHQYRDVIVGSAYGHMNIDHFILQDHHEVDIADNNEDAVSTRTSEDATGDISIQSRSGYLNSLRKEWTKMPSPPADTFTENSSAGDWFSEDATSDDIEDTQAGKSRRKRYRRFLKKIGGTWAERYSVSLVSPSLVPNYFPTLRVVEYNITGLDTINEAEYSTVSDISGRSANEVEEDPMDSEPTQDLGVKDKGKGKKRKDKKKKKKKKPSFKVPEPPSSTAPPGPAYSNQPLTWLGYTQYFANLTRINNEYAKQHYLFAENLISIPEGDGVNMTGYNNPFAFEVEYNTRTDKVYRLEDLTVRSYFKLATRIAKSEAGQSEVSEIGTSINATDDDIERVTTKQKWKKTRNRAWETFLKRAFVGYYKSGEVDED
ncbi:endopolyphosphatase [Aspergillus clavatus NRRL 1]|uniref:Endopolyphosphatase n=1 Tax=Aspergillus clavatus (strain ATCC 1007 / CBS 513.65 / DSM 816 / NCTC 3887 / NRRL 1 / QM 1276 / 107) TaxID=344612 RepID=A1CPY0_ASPCL|nr:vacuolar endopolyphosphatase, putative [Aspergillus clavatus NRRL 1]EAW07701.1 vacuolar endopolyphosphatase, putative [Aspergillus clavatus NRRL 1]